MAKCRAGWIGLLLVAFLTLVACSPAASTALRPVSPTARATLSSGVGSTERTVTVDGVSRTYFAVGPSHKPGLPLVIVLHGRGYTARQESQRTGFLPYAQRGLADLVYPQGTANSWNDGHGCCGKAGASGVDDVGFVTQVVGDASRFFGSDPRRVYLVGYSNGARLAFEEVCRHPALFAAFATYAALPPAKCSGGPPMRVFIGGGAKDSLMQSEGSVTNTVGWWRSRDDCRRDATTTHTGPLTLTTWTQCRGGSSVASATYAGIGHAWPVATANGLPYTVPVGPDAAAATVMWNFLTEHPA